MRTITKCNKSISALNFGRTEKEALEILNNLVLFDNFKLADIFKLLKEYPSQYVSIPNEDIRYLIFQNIAQKLKDESHQKILHFFNVDIKYENIVKFIYVILEDKQIRVANEPLHTKNRPTHSELANGRPVLAGGELIFRYIDNSWKLWTVNNGSGHYRPPPASLSVARDLIPPILTVIGIDCSLMRYYSSLRPDLAVGSMLILQRLEQVDEDCLDTTVDSDT